MVLKSEGDGKDIQRMRILGLNFGHSAAATLVVNGRVVSAVEEEKLTRVKGESSFPINALDFVLKKNNVSIEDVDFVALGCKRLVEFSYGYRQLNKYFRRHGFLDHIAGYFWDGLKRLFPRQINTAPVLERYIYNRLKEIGIPRSKVRLINHHEAHAASAYYTSPWDHCAVVTSDGKGDGACGTFYVGEQGVLKIESSVRDLDSVGQFYQSVTKFLGFRINRHEGKITGLAAFGDHSKTYPLMNRVFSFDNGVPKNHFYDSRDFVNDPLKYYKKHVEPKDFIHYNYLKSLPDQELRCFAAVYQLFLNWLKKSMGQFESKDVAAGIQKLTEDTLVAYVEKHLTSRELDRLCLAGGVFANVKVNQRLREIPGVKNIYVQPAMDDAGTSLGAALAVWMSGSDSKKWNRLETVYLGPDYTDQQIEEALNFYRLPYQKVPNYEEVLGRMIYEGKIIGRFNGALEWGPRALGNRSIIARPIYKEINDILNARLQRTEFMPFAPSILADDAKDFLVGYSDNDIAAKYMTVTYDVKKDMIDKIPATVHVDGTARPQVVTMEDNPSFYKIIRAYKKHSGFGVVINTSFNMHEEPIVCAPSDAIRAYLSGAVDVLSIGPYIVDEQQRN